MKSVPGIENNSSVVHPVT